MAASAASVSVWGSSRGNDDGDDGGDEPVVISKGDRSSVYWPDDDQWYDGRVHSQVAAGWWGHYDDGDKEFHVPGRFVHGGSSSGAPGPKPRVRLEVANTSETEQEITPTTPPRRPTTRRST